MQILSTTDLHTNLVNYDYHQDKPSQTVGLSKTAVLIKKARETNPNTVLVDRGDTIQGIPFGTYKALIDPVAQGETHPIYKAFEMLGYDAETLGNHEFNYGLEFLDHMVKAAKINIINVNVRNAQTGDYYYNPYKIVNKTFTDTDGKWKVVNSKAKLEKNDTKSDIADKDLIDMAAYDHNGPSTQAGFAEYRLSVKEKANQVDDTTNKESEKSPKGVETTDQSKREISKATVVASVAKPAPASQLSNAQVVILPQAQVQETQGLSSVKALPNTGSDESVSVTLAGLILMTLARCFGIKKHEKIKQEKKPLSGLFCSCFTN